MEGQGSAGRCRDDDDGRRKEPPAVIPARVSVIIPCYTHGLYLGDAIESVLRQSWSNLEVIVVDDGSEDDTAAVAARYSGVRYIRQRNQGLAAARNAGAAASSGDFLIFLDADDRLAPGAIEAGMRCFTENPGSGLVYGAGIGFDESGPLQPAVPCIPPAPEIG